MPGRREKSQSGVALGWSNFDPALAGSHRLVSLQYEAELVDVEVQRSILIFDWHAGEFDLANHDDASNGLSWIRNEYTARHSAVKGSVHDFASSRNFDYYIYKYYR